MELTVKNFTLEELHLFKLVENKILDYVICHWWVNKVKNEPMRFLDWIELRFEDGYVLTISADHDNQAVKVKSGKPDLTAIKENLLKEYGEAIFIQSTNESEAENGWWKEVIGLPINTVELQKGENGFYHNGALLLVFDTYPILVYVSDEGLDVELMEDDETN